MDLSFTEGQEALRGLARQIFDGHATLERLKEVEAGPERIDRALWAELARANLLGVGIPDQHGGIGGGMVELCVLLEEQGRAVAPVPLLPTLVTGALPVAVFGSDELRARLLPRVVAGEAILTAALSEPGSEDPTQPATTADARGRLTGVKAMVPAAHVAEHVLVPARAVDGQVRVYLVDPRDDGVAMTRHETSSREPRFTLTLDGVRPADVLGGDDTARWMYERALVGLCAIQAGCAERALRLTAEYTGAREQFSRPLATFQAVQQRAADAYIDAHAIRWTMWQAAWRLDAGLPASEEVAIAKFWAADGGARVVAAAQHLHGGMGVDTDYPLHRYTLWSKQLELALGSATPQLAALGAMIAARAKERT